MNNENKKTEKISDAIGQLDEKLITEADEKRTERGVKNRRGLAKRIWIPAVSVAACAAVFCGAALMGNKTSPGLVPVLFETLAEAKYPEAAPYPDESRVYSDEESEKMYTAWGDQRKECWEAAEALDEESLMNFYRLTSDTFLKDSGGKNRVYSPVNLYMALSMLAEVTDGGSREQILKLAGAESIEELREQAANLWKTCYQNDGATKTVLANSIWVRSDKEFNSDTLNTLADEYFASVYRGDFSSEETVNALREWLNRETDGLLEESVNNLPLSPETVMALCSTICFHAKWDWEFDPENNDTKAFHGIQGDFETEFMNKTDDMGCYYWGSDYGAVYLKFANGGNMWLILPDEGKTVGDVLKSGEYMEMIKDSFYWENQKNMKVNLSVPKFDVSSDIDLSEGLEKLGVKDVFESGKADFSPLSKDSEGWYINTVQHAARVVIDEEGCTAVAFTAMVAATGGFIPVENEIDFILDRPFMFVITSEFARQPLFVGTVFEP